MVLKELEVGFNKLSDNNIQLRKEKSELGKQLGARTAEKLAVEKILEKLKTDSNATEFGLKQRIVSTPRFQPRSPGMTELCIYRRPVRKRLSPPYCHGSTAPRCRTPLCSLPVRSR